ncbi:MAG: DUF5320 domain-containing protein [Armatimonadota bacterium]
MPQRDGTGPNGQGQTTGRGVGGCTPDGQPVSPDRRFEENQTFWTWLGSFAASMLKNLSASAKINRSGRGRSGGRGRGRGKGRSS